MIRYLSTSSSLSTGGSGFTTCLSLRLVHATVSCLAGRVDKPSEWRNIATASAKRRQADSHETHAEVPEEYRGSTMARSMAEPIRAEYEFTVPYTFSASFAKDHITAAFMPVIPSKIIDGALEAVASDGRGRHEDRASLFNNAEKRCVLCDVATVEMGRNYHTLYFMHQARLGVVERAIALVNWHLHLVSEQLRARGLAASPRRGGAMRRAPPGEPAAGGQGMAHLFSPGPGGLPSIEEVWNRPQILKDNVAWDAVLIEHWWRALDVRATDLLSPSSRSTTASAPGLNVATCDFNRVPALSSDSAIRRKWRMRFLLRFLTERGVVRDSLQLKDDRSSGASFGSFGRSTRFERCEMIGDNVLKNVIRDRLLRLFPIQEGGLTGRLAMLQQTVDSNPGLLAIYDYLGLDGIVGVRLPNTKTKADVIESLFGELQTFLSASETYRGVSRYPAFLDKERGYVRVVVEHVMQELAHLVVIWRLGETVSNAKEFIEANTIDLWIARDGAPLGAAASVAPAGGGSRRRGRRGTDGTAALAVAEESIDRSPYDPLPLLTPFSRGTPQKFEDGRDLWHHAKHVANTKAGPHQELHRLVSDEPLPGAGDALRAHYSQAALRVTGGARREHAEPADPDAPIPAADEVGAKDLSPGANRFPSWKAADSHRWELQDLLQRESRDWLPEADLDAVLRRGVAELSKAPGPRSQDQGTPRDTVGTYPDLTTKRQPPQYNARQGERLVLECLIR